MPGWCALLLRALLLLCVLAAARASAQESDESKRLLQEALTEFNAGRWDEAYALFSRLNAHDPGARTLRGMGFSAFEARRYANAVVNLAAALAEKRRPLSADQRAEVEKVLAQANGFVARFRVVLRPDDAQLTVDGRKPKVDRNGELLLDPGTHELLASAPGYASLRRTVNAQAGDRDALTLQLETRAPIAGPLVAASPESPASPESADDRDAQAHDSSRNLTGVYVAGAAAVAFAGAAIGLHFAAKGAEQQVLDECPNRCIPVEADGAIESSNLELFQTLSFVGWGLAGASAATAVVLFVLAPEEDGAELSLRVSPGFAKVRVAF